MQIADCKRGRYTIFVRFEEKECKVIKTEHCLLKRCSRCLHCCDGREVPFVFRKVELQYDCSIAVLCWLQWWLIQVTLCIGVCVCSMLFERRIIVTSKRLSRLTSCIHAAAALIYPMNWWVSLFVIIVAACPGCINSSNRLTSRTLTFTVFMSISIFILVFHYLFCFGFICSIGLASSLLLRSQMYSIVSYGIACMLLHVIWLQATFVHSCIASSSSWILRVSYWLCSVVV